MNNPQTDRRRRKARIRGLDGYRAVAVIGIVLYHMCPGIFPGGFLGVNAFFVLMGFLMVYTVGQSGYEAGRVTEKKPGLSYAKNYYLKKIRRLYVPMILMIAVSVVIAALFVPSLVKNMASEILSVVFGYNNWFQVAASSSYFARMQNSSPFTHLWYLGLTIQYYALWPLLFYAASKLSGSGDSRKRRLLVFGIAAVLAVLSGIEMAVLYSPQADPSRIYYGTDTRAFALLGGILLGIIPFQRVRRYRGWNRFLMPAGVILTIIMMISWFTMKGTDPFTYQGGMQINTVLSILLLWLILRDQRKFARLGQVFPLRQIGAISYEIYLVMYPCIYFVQKLTGQDSGAGYIALCWTAILLSALVLHFFSDAILEKADRKGTDRRLAAVMAVVLAASIGVQSFSSMMRGGGQDMKDLENQLADNAVEARKNKRETLTSVNVKALESTRANIDNQIQAIADSYGDLAAARQALAETQTVPASLNVTMIGDSVMLGSSPVLTEQIEGSFVDAKVSRQVWDGAEVVQSLASQGLLADTVVVHLGTNGPGMVDNYKDVLNAIGKGRKVYWITGYGANIDSASILANIQAAQDEYPNVHILRWDEKAQGHPEYFVSDGVHLTVAGEEAYTAMVKEGTGL